MSGAVADLYTKNSPWSTWSADAIKFRMRQFARTVRSGRSVTGEGALNLAAFLTNNLGTTAPDKNSVQNNAVVKGGASIEGTRGGDDLVDGDPMAIVGPPPVFTGSNLAAWSAQNAAWVKAYSAVAGALTLSGDRDIFGNALSSSDVATAESNGTAWQPAYVSANFKRTCVGEVWNMELLAGCGFVVDKDPNSSTFGFTIWPTADWSQPPSAALGTAMKSTQKMWSGKAVVENNFTGHSWSGHRWSGTDWVGHSWSGHSWSGHCWRDAGWA